MHIAIAAPMGCPIPAAAYFARMCWRTSFAPTSRPRMWRRSSLSRFWAKGDLSFPPPEFLQKLKAVCERYEILFIADEVQTGIGRTGRMFAIEHFGVVPDLILLGKSLASGLPLSAVVGRAEVMDAPPAGGLGSTFGGNPLACQAALAVIEMIEEANLLERAQELGEKFQAFFRNLQQRFRLIGDVRGLGAMVAVELVLNREQKTPAPGPTRVLLQKCCEKGLILLAAGIHDNVLRVLAPLVMTDEQQERAFAILEEVFAEVEALTFGRPGA